MVVMSPKENTKRSGPKLKKLEKELQYSYDANEVPPEDVFAYNELRSCADLFRMYKDKILIMQPDYQREIVWSLSDQSRFIDSLTKELPIPSMCFSMDSKTQNWQVIDGLQRIATIIKFLGEPIWQISKLQDIDPRISNKTVNEIRKGSPELYRRVENLTLPITVLRCDFSRRDHLEYIFTIFHRLNTGGLRLSNQEIRNAIYQGSFNNLLKECDKNENWILVLGASRRRPDRFQGQELILRFFSFFEGYKEYKGKLISFLNDYMRKNRDIDGVSLKKKKDIFERTVGVVSTMYKKTTEERLSNVVLDAVLFGVAKNLDHLEKLEVKELKKRFTTLIKNQSFSKENISEGTLQRVKVIKRLETAAKTFSK